MYGAIKFEQVQMRFEKENDYILIYSWRSTIFLRRTFVARILYISYKFLFIFMCRNNQLSSLTTNHITV